MHGSFETQLDKATTQPLALEAPRRSPLTWPALEPHHDFPVMRTQSIHRSVISERHHVVLINMWSLMDRVHLVLQVTLIINIYCRE
ncbi:hypothetical protein MTO96_011502 [Rhipicephalus appendiculatus]